MKIADYDEVLCLWSDCGIVTNYADTFDGIDHFLKRNPGFCYVALDKTQIVAAVLCGNDARHGYLCHLCVNENFRHLGIAKKLINKVLEALSEADVKNCHVLVHRDNHDALNFWEKNGWDRRDEFVLMTRWAGNDRSD